MSKTLAFIFLSVFIFSACTPDVGERSKSLVNIYLIDSPGEFDQLWIELLGVEIQVENQNQPVFLPYSSNEKNVNLSALVGGSKILVGRGEFPLGILSGISLRLGTDNYVMKDGEKLPLFSATPEGSSPIIDVDFELNGGIAHDFYVDFDVYGSVISSTTGDGRYYLDPKIRVFEKSATGEIAGNISPSNLNAVIYAIRDLDTLSTGVATSANNKFLFQGLKGSYTLIVDPKDPIFRADTIYSVMVEKGKITQLGNIILDIN